MSQPQKLSIQFSKEESFSASINLVRQLSEGAIHRDPTAPIVKAERRPTNIRPFPATQIQNPRIRVFKPLSEWQVRKLGYIARTGKSASQINAERAARERERWRKAKEKAQ